jgi:23S rRNA (cytosine1962-C5)-methyltransferase
MTRPERPFWPQNAPPERETTQTASVPAGLTAQRLLSDDFAPSLPKVFVKSPTGHPYIYRKRVARFDAALRPGGLASVCVERGNVFAYGLFNPRAEISVRLLCWGPERPDEPFWTEKLTEAVALRRNLLGLDAHTDAYRVLHSEGDGLSGIVVDRFGDVLSGEAFSLGMFQRGGDLLDRLNAILGTKSWILSPGPASFDQEAFDAEPLRSADAPAAVTVQEYGTRFRVKFAEGHKTGFFCDQRENRRRLAGYCSGKTVLDLCCYTGGFAVQAKKLGNAADVTGVDLDEGPLQLARENANLNQVRVNFVQSDAFAYMRDMLRNGRQYDVVVLDPPKLIRTRDELEDGRRKHFDLNRLAMQLVRPGGLLLSCTCSGLLDDEEFFKLLHSASRQSGELLDTPPDAKARHASRTMQILEKSGAAPDHPVASNCPETEYLRAVWMRLH